MKRVAKGMAAVAAIGVGGAALFSVHPALTAVQGESMGPEYNGDLVLTTHGIPDVGDVVIYESAEVAEAGSAKVIHRVIEKDGDKLITRGDANPEADPAITTDAVIGIERARVDGAGNLVHSPMVVGPVIAASALALLWPDKRFERVPVKAAEEEEQVNA